MDITLFLAKLWGPIIFAVGVGIIANRGYYLKVYRDLEKNVLAAFVFGIVAMTVGIAHVLSHNLWGSWLEALVSFLGWAMLAKGVAFIIAPRMVDKAGDFYAAKNRISFIGFLPLVLGAILSWIAYF